MSEVERFEMTPHPVEFDMYYSAWCFAGSRPRISRFTECERRPPGRFLCLRS